MFDWQIEMYVPAKPPKAARVVTLPPPVASTVISFAQALKALTKAVSNDNLSQPLIRGERVSIKITQDIYEKGMTACKTNLRGRLVLNKGDKPFATKEIQSKLQKLWKTTGAWKMMSLGRGCGFDCLNCLGMEQTLREIASAIDTPLLIDNAASKRLFGHYARILVDMDFSRKLFHEIDVEREGSDIPVQRPLEATSLEATLEMDAASQSQGDNIIDHSDDIPVVTPTIMVTHISHSPAITNNTFSIQLENVSDEIARNDLAENQEHILSSVKEKTSDVSSIVAPNGAPIDPVL
ncbi:hypothetical protein MTR_5g048840 [Medicago truncatula]|uniref:DUF4283 domain protein n=1 Tax=Medicago truncatula TaxID=3880 RepID=A0A072UDR3_MEDTR|nr:hypothetical protein MTR_5g048840 [Medicago truncatula]